MSKNNPNDSRRYNYVYKITNNLNFKIYIGVHRTDNLDDNYMGSGKMIRYAYEKYGINNFTKEILKFFDTYKEALDYEKSIVTPLFIEEKTNYNIKEGGYGGCVWSSQMKEHFSKVAKKRNSDTSFKEKMRDLCYNNKERNKKLGESISKWIINNPEKHKAKMLKINKNPEKINKTANTHTGMKRSETACKNITQGCIEYVKSNKEKKSIDSGKGSFYIKNITTGKVKKFYDKHNVPVGWEIGIGSRKNKEGYKNMNKGSFFVHNIETLQIKRIQKGNEVPAGFIKGRPQK